MQWYDILWHTVWIIRKSTGDKIWRPLCFQVIWPRRTTSFKISRKYLGLETLFMPDLFSLLRIGIPAHHGAEKFNDLAELFLLKISETSDSNCFQYKLPVTIIGLPDRGKRHFPYSALCFLMYTRLQTVWSLPGPSRQANKGHSPRCYRRPNGPGPLADKVVQPTTQSAEGCTFTLGSGMLFSHMTQFVATRTGAWMLLNAWAPLRPRGGCPPQRPPPGSAPVQCA